ncbi:ABC-type branched-subunit amino acid transport system substrate-binding protein [Bradyrhizobium sp. USDA 4469]
MSAIIRKIVTVVEETRMEMGRQVSPPTRRAAAIAVIENPFAGQYVEDLSPLIAIGEELGDLLAKRAVAALGIDGAKAHSYGKAAAVGENGELEHAAAILHPKMGAPVRKVLSKGAALIPSSKKRSGPGTTLDIPLGHKDAGLRTQPFRRHGGADQRRAARQRDHGRGRRYRQRPSAAARRRADGCRDQGRRRVEIEDVTSPELEVGMRARNYFVGAAFALLAAGMGHSALAEDIKIGEINSYSLLPSFTEPYRKGWQLAVEEINAAGGVNGKKLVVISKDDGGKPADAQTAANELVSSEGVVMLTGTFLSNIGLAVSDFANQKKVFFLAAEPLTDAVTWAKGNKYTFRLRPSNYMQAAMLVEAASKLPAKRWATIAPNYEYGQSAVAVFKKLMSEKRPDIQWVDEQWPPQGKIDAGPVVQAVAQANPEAILNVTFGPDLVKLVREGNTRGLFKGREVVSFLTGEPEYLDPLKDETPEGWIVTGYPWYSIKTPEHEAFLKAYQAKYNDYPRLGSIVGYQTIKAAAAIIAKAGSTDTDKMIAAAEGISMPSPFGEITFRKIDHQSTLGAFVGKTAQKDGKGVMVDATYKKGSDYLPSDAEVEKLRPKD